MMTFALPFALPPLHFYNSLGRRLELFEAHLPGKVQMYTCGPTVYDFVHIGNLRTFVFEDILRRVLKMFGYQVHQVMNLTDVDDKTIRGSIREGISLRQFTDVYAKAFFEDIDCLGIERADHYPRATDYIDAMIEMIQALMDKGYAYQGNDKSVYFSIERFTSYGRLAQLERHSNDFSHSRISHDEYDKDIVGDFVLWKAHDPQRDADIAWDSPWGRGRPGWHIECSAMATKILGEQLDIHTGGIDNLFPHHENEIAQSECCHDKPFAKYWLHAEHLVVDGRKMSKSLGNFYTLRQLLEKGFAPVTIRYLLLQTHYRHSLNFTLEGLRAAARSVQRLQDFHYRLCHAKGKAGMNQSAKELTQTALLRFVSALADDLNTSAALASVFEWVQEINRLMDELELFDGDLAYVKHALEYMDKALGILDMKQEPQLPQEVQQLFEMRQEARAQKQWAQADKLRDELMLKGFTIEDSPSGSRLKRHLEGQA